MCRHPSASPFNYCDMNFLSLHVLICKMAAIVPSWHISVKSALTRVKGFSYKLCYHYCCHYHFWCISGCLGNTLPHFLLSILCVLPLCVSFEFLVSIFTELRLSYFSWVTLLCLRRIQGNEDTVTVPSILFCPPTKRSMASCFLASTLFPRPAWFPSDRTWQLLCMFSGRCVTSQWSIMLSLYSFLFQIGQGRVLLV